MRDAIVEELRILHRCQKIPQPAESFSSHRRIKLIEEDERDLTLEHKVAHQMKCVGQLFRGLVLRKIERQRLDRSGPAKLAECLCHHLDPE